MNRLDTLRQEMLGEKYTFEDAVKYVSQDKDTRNNKGMMFNDETGTTRFEMAELPQEISKVVAGMSVGEISKPFIMKDPKLSRDVVAIVKLTNRIASHRANMSDDYQQILSMYEQSARKKILNDWLAKNGWRDCDFEHEGWIKTTSSNN